MLTSPSIAAAAPTILSSFLLAGGARGQPFSFFSNIGDTFFQGFQNEASGLDIAPDGSHLIGVSDEGKVFFLNLEDYDAGHCFVDIIGDLPAGSNDLEGVAIDTAAWTTADKRAYIVHEGADDSEPILFEIQYTYDPSGPSCSVTIVGSQTLVGAIPCLTTPNGIESFGLKTPSSGGDPAVFFAGIQDTGKVYEVTSDGESVGPDSCYDAGLRVPDVSASNFDGTYLWSIIDNQDALAAIDPAGDCTLATWPLPNTGEDQEGLVIDFANDLMYVAVDGQDNPSTVAVYNFTYPALHPDDFCCGDGVCGGNDEDCNTCPQDCDSRTKGNVNSQYCCAGPNNDCGDPGCTACTGVGLGAELCSGFAVCGGTAPPSRTPTAAPTATCAAKKASCTADSDCCGNKCKGGANKTCK